LSTTDHGTYYSVTLTGVTTLNGSTKGDLDWTLSEIDQDLPVELTSFTAVFGQNTFVTLEWITQSETNEAGFNIFRNIEEDLNSAVQVNSNIIEATNTSYEHIYRFQDFIVSDDDFYYYWLQDVSNNGTVTYHGPVKVELGNHGQITPQPNIPLVTSVQSIFPNPFNPQATINYGVAKKGMVNIKIYNAKGQTVRRLVSNELVPSNYRVMWDGKDMKGQPCASGVYFIELVSGNVKSSLRAVLLK
jgi:hypothetical protein